jgi:hypothetical protein
MGAIREALNFVGSVGFSYSSFQTADIDLGANGTLELADSSSTIGFMSGALPRTRLQPNALSLIKYFGMAAKTHCIQAEALPGLRIVNRCAFCADRSHRASPPNTARHPVKGSSVPALLAG